MKGEVNETSCPGASALPSLSTVRCLWCQQKAVDPSRKALQGWQGRGVLPAPLRHRGTSSSAVPRCAPCSAFWWAAAFSLLPGCGCSQVLGPSTGCWHRPWLTPWLGPAHDAVSASGAIQWGLPQHAVLSPSWVPVVYLNGVFQQWGTPCSAMGSAPYSTPIPGTARLYLLHPSFP